MCIRDRICPACGELLDNSTNSTEQTQPANNIYTNHNVSPAPVIPQIPDYKVQSILLIVFSCVLCCISCISILALPFAIVALVNSNKISAHLVAGNLDLAQEADVYKRQVDSDNTGLILFPPAKRL